MLMIEIFNSLPPQQRDLASQHDGVVRMMKLAQRYRQLVAQLTGRQLGPSPVPALLHVQQTEEGGRNSRRLG